MATKNFIITFPDSNGDRQVVPMQISCGFKSLLENSEIRKVCEKGLENYMTTENADREDCIVSALKEDGYSVQMLLSNFAVLEL